MPFEDENNTPNNDPQPTDSGDTTAMPSTEPAVPSEVDAVNNAAEAITSTPDGNDDLPTDKPVSPNIKALLDTISADAPAPTEAPTPADNPAEEEPAVPKVEEPKTPEQEEAELLDGVKSERGKERIQKVFSERKALEAELGEIRTIIQSTKMTPDQFAQTLEFGRLVNSGNETDLRVALEMVEQQRAMIYQQLGVEAPGVDLLAGHDDLKSAVDNMEITRERAVELAKLRKAEAERMQKTQAQQQSQQATQRFQQTVQTAAQQMESYLATRVNEVDHMARMKVISDHFRNPANLQNFVNTYQPEQWTSTIKFMYDNIQVPKAAAAPRDPQPLRSRPASLGSPSPAGANPIDRIASHIDNMGL